ncbi:MAG: hypothetical protein WCG79_08635 [Verrucomicrobiota bacterium]|jgi:hypothetical protein
MKHWLWFSICLVGALTTEAAHVKLLSPDAAQTYAIGWVVDHSFAWNAQTRQFGAYLQFNNRSATKWREEESFRFVFPEVKFDATNRTFYATDAHNQPVPIAELRTGWLGRSIVPAPGTTVLIANEHGKVRLVLTASSEPKGRNTSVACWIERSDAWVLQNLLRDVAGVN